MFIRCLPVVAITGFVALVLTRGPLQAQQPAAASAFAQTLRRDQPAAVDFTRDIQPILESRCFGCHGPTAASNAMRLDVRAVVTPGNSEQSLIVRRLLGLDGLSRMPKGGEPLPSAEIALIRAWIDQGARWPARGDSQPEHWAYRSPGRPPLPAVRDTAWVRTPIDRFVLARLESEGLAPSPEASLETLVRRVSLDLIGLPPSPQDVDEVAADAARDGRDAAYARLVDRLLASPHYGERWARPWLDLARYADSHGFEKDLPRVMWKYRDWVIDALNRDMPFDRFTIEQIAGDMLPNATPEQVVASGFHRNAMTNEEGGTDPEESHYEVLVDRVNTTATVWLGSTLGCAQCHNHKYDPFTQRDYYRLMAFFGNSDYEIPLVRRRHTVLRGRPRSADARAGGQTAGDSGPDRSAERGDEDRVARVRAGTSRVGAGDAARGLVALDRADADEPCGDRRRDADGGARRVGDRHRRKPGRDDLYDRDGLSNRSGRPDRSGRRRAARHGDSSRGAARSVTAQRRSRTRSLRQLPVERI